MLAAAVAAFALIFVLRELGGAPGDGVSFLYVIPVILVALEYGPVAGVAAGLAGVALFAIWDATTDNSVSVVAYITRTVSFVVVGWLTGRMVKARDGVTWAVPETLVGTDSRW